MPILLKHRVCLFSLLRFFDEHFDLMIDDPFMTLKKTLLIFRLFLFCFAELEELSKQFQVCVDPDYFQKLENKIKHGMYVLDI